LVYDEQLPATHLIRTFPATPIVPEAAASIEVVRVSSAGPSTAGREPVPDVTLKLPGLDAHFWRSVRGSKQLLRSTNLDCHSAPTCGDPPFLLIEVGDKAVPSANVCQPRDGVGAENLIRTRSAGLSSGRAFGRNWTMALSFLYLAFVRMLQSLRLLRSDKEELAIEVVMLRHEVAVLRRQVDRALVGSSSGPRLCLAGTVVAKESAQPGEQRPVAGPKWTSGIDPSTLNLYLAGVTANPMGAWITQQARKKCIELGERSQAAGFLI
jgi:hypothetical protein